MDSENQFVCRQCGERRSESDRAKGDGINICLLCDDENGFRELVVILNRNQFSTDKIESTHE